MANRYSENAEQLSIWERLVINQNLIQEEVWRRLSSGNACYHSVHSLLSSHLLPKNVNNGIRKTTILPVVLYGSENWSLILREKHRLRAIMVINLQVS
jgi:hypothetical protein